MDKIHQLSDQNGGDAGEVALFGVGRFVFFENQLFHAFSYEVALWSVGGCISAVEQVWYLFFGYMGKMMIQERFCDERLRAGETSWTSCRKRHWKRILSFQ